MKKVMFVIGQMSNGGAERVVWANSLCDQYDISVVCPIKDELVYELDTRVQYFGNNISIHNNIKRKIQHYQFIHKCYNKIIPDIVISFTTEINIYCCIYKIFHNIPRLIISERNDPKRDPKSKGKRIARKCLYWIADKCVFQTQYAMECFSKAVQHKGTVIFNPVSSELPYSEVNEREKKIVSISRLQKQKNIPLMINAFERFHQLYEEYVLEIYGDGSEKSNIEGLIAERNLEDCVKLMGFCKDVHDRIKSASMFLLTSNYEGMSNAMIEALCMGIPTICTDCPAYSAREFIKDGENGYLIDVGDLDQLISKMILLENNKDLSAQFSENTKRLRQVLSTDVISRKWKEIIEDEKN